MVYEWDDKQDICHQLYVEEHKPLDEVMKYMKEVYGFDPSKRAFQTQFRRWNFPSKHNPAYRNEPLVARIRELWEANTSQREMSKILKAEGYDIKDRELMRVRARNRWLLRVPNGTKSFGPVADYDSFNQTLNAAMPKINSDDGTTTAAKTTAERLTSDLWHEEEPDNSQQDDMGVIGSTLLNDDGTTDQGSMSQLEPQRAPSPALSNASESLPPAVLEKKQKRMAELEAESADLWAAKKRRRRTRGYGGLPADPPGPPRFPSETTLDESKAFLHLDNDLYRQLRHQFQTICEESGFVKKTIAGPDKWQAAKDRLVAENLHLNREFTGPFNGVPSESKSLALDVVCTDVTKRMRTDERRMTIADAKNLLEINPEESRRVRNEFYQILKKDHFTSKLEAGGQRWNQLKEEWIQNSRVLSELLASGDADPKHGEKVKAIEILARDVMKRLRDNTNRHDPSKKRLQNLGPGPGPMGPQWSSQSPKRPSQASLPLAPTAPMVSTPTLGSKPPRTRSNKSARSTPHKHALDASTATANDTMQIDPSLLAAATDPLLAEQLQRYAASAEGAAATFADPSSNFPNVGPSLIPNDSVQLNNNPTASVAVLFRLSAASPIQTGPKVWLATLSSTSTAELHQRAVHNRQNAVNVQKIEGLIRDQAGGETLFPIDHDDELEAYLQYVSGIGSKAQFAVQLVVGQFVI